MVTKILKKIVLLSVVFMLLVVVNILDRAIVAKAFGSRLGDPNWNPIADLNDDEEVNILDAGIIAAHWGEEFQDYYSLLLGKGVNYLSLYHMYSSDYTTDDILRRDFSRFQQDGINVISLSLSWYRLEGNTRGDYDGEYAPYPVHKSLYTPLPYHQL